MTLAERLTKHEGMRLKPYVDCCGKRWRDCGCRLKGKLTIGVGRNLDDVGLSAQEADLLLGNDIQSAMRVTTVFPWFEKLNETRQEVLIELIFNMGFSTVLNFRKMLEAMNAGDFDLAASELLNSKWSSQVGRRAAYLAEALRQGEFKA